MTPAWVGWLMLGCVLLAVVLVLVWPKGADPQLHPGFGDLTDEAAAIREERDLMRAELRQLAQGEEPVTDPATNHTPGQWIWRWNRATPDERLEIASLVLHNAAMAGDCFMTNHKDQLEKLRAERNELGGLLADLDRCTHGRHEGDACLDCGGTSRGNHHLRPGTVIGYGLRGVPIVMPQPDEKYYPRRWYMPVRGAWPADPLHRALDGSQAGVDTEHEDAPERPAAPGAEANPGGIEGER